MSLSSLEHKLTYHMRYLLKNSSIEWNTLYVSAFTIALLSCIPAGLITQISLYSEPWKLHLHYSEIEINILSSAVNIGGYLTPPFLGLLSDAHGPIFLSWMSCLGFVPAYAYLSYVFATAGDHFYASVFCCAVIGVSTSALYFSALFTCSRLYPEHKLLSISLPTTGYGLASVVGSGLLKLPWFSNGMEYLNLTRVFGFLAITYAVVCVATLFSTSFVSMVKERATTAGQYEALGCDEGLTEPLLTPNVGRKVNAFLRDGSALTLFIIMLLTLGPLEMFLTNMGSLSRLMHHPSVLSHFAVASTAARFATGLVADGCGKYNISKITILWIVICLGVLGQAMLLFNVNHAIGASSLNLTSVVNGTCYGALFTITPIITLSIWGDSIFGTAYGSFMVAPAIGSTFFGFSYASTFDNGCGSLAYPDTSPKCIQPAFVSTLFSMVAALLLSVGVYFLSWRRRER